MNDHMRRMQDRQFEQIQQQLQRDLRNHNVAGYLLQQERERDALRNRPPRRYVYEQPEEAGGNTGETIKGVVFGAGVGAMVGGPIGALIGGVLGGLVSGKQRR